MSFPGQRNEVYIFENKRFTSELLSRGDLQKCVHGHTLRALEARKPERIKTPNKNCAEFRSSEVRRNGHSSLPPDQGQANTQTF
jgi:hypothetical protein